MYAAENVAKKAATYFSKLLDRKISLKFANIKFFANSPNLMLSKFSPHTVCIPCTVHQDPNCQVTLLYCTYKYTAICCTVLLLAPDVEHVWPVSEAQSLPCMISRQSNT